MKNNFIFATGSKNAIPHCKNDRRFMINKSKMKATPFNLMKVMAAGWIAGQLLILVCEVIV